MLRFLKKVINTSVLKKIQFPAVLRFKKVKNMSGESSKIKADLNLDSNPAKKMKLEVEETPDVGKRTVATMAGAWRPEEQDGGLIFVFKKREECLSPDPKQESDFPENIEDFWEASLMGDAEIKVSYQHFPRVFLFKYLINDKLFID